MMSICSYYKGRLSFSEIMNMPIDYIHSFEYLMYKHKDDHKQQKEAEALEDQLEQLM